MTKVSEGMARVHTLAATGAGRRKPS